MTGDCDEFKGVAKGIQDETHDTNDERAVHDRHSSRRGGRHDRLGRDPHATSRSVRKSQDIGGGLVAFRITGEK